MIQTNIKTRKVKPKKGKNLFEPYMFVAPFFIGFLIFSAFPIFYSFYLSFFRWNGIRIPEYVGISNYIFILTKDQTFWKALLNTLFINILSGIPQHVFALALAFILNQGLVKAKEFFKGVMFLPYITSTAAISVIFLTLLGLRGGVNSFLQVLMNFGIPNPNHFLSLVPNTPEYIYLFREFGLDIKLPLEFIRGPLIALSISMVIVWKWTGWNVIIYLSGLLSINNDVYDAARIDGATWPQIFFKITLPLLKPVIYFATSMTLIYGMQIFDEPVILDGIDGALNNGGYSITAAIYIYINAFKWGSFGVATAASYALCLFILILSKIYQKVMSAGEI